MGFFSKLFGGTNEDEIDFNVYLEFAKLISLDDEKVLSDLEIDNEQLDLEDFFSELEVNSVFLGPGTKRT